MYVHVCCHGMFLLTNRLNVPDNTNQYKQRNQGSTLIKRILGGTAINTFRKIITSLFFPDQEKCHSAERQYDGKECVSFRHQYNCRSDPNEPIKGKVKN